MDGEYHPTGAGLLMFGDEYNIVRHYPEYFLDYREMLDPTIRRTDCNPAPANGLMNADFYEPRGVVIDFQCVE